MSREIFRSEEGLPGMTPSQAIESKLLDRLNDGSASPRQLELFVKRYKREVEEKNRGAGKFWTALESIAPTDEEKAEKWMALVVEKTLADKDAADRQKKGEFVERDKSYYELEYNVRKAWGQLSFGGKNNVEVDLGRTVPTVNVTSNYDNGFGYAADQILSYVGTAWDTAVHSKVARGIALGAVLSTTAAACAPVKEPTPMVAPLPTNAQTGTEPTAAAVTPTTAPTQERIPTVVKTPTEVPILRGGEYSRTQQELINSVEGQGRIRMCRQAVDNWTSSQNPNRRFDRANVTEIHLFWDNLDTNKVTGFLCAAAVTNPQTGAITYYTLDHGDFGNQNGINLAPMPISSGDEQHVLMSGNIEGQGWTFTRVGTDGQVSQYVDKRTGQWTTLERGLSFEPCTDWRTARERCVVNVSQFLSNEVLDYSRDKTPGFSENSYAISFANLINSNDGAGIQFGPYATDSNLAEITRQGANGLWSINNDIFTGDRSPVETTVFWIEPDGVKLKLPTLGVVLKINVMNPVTGQTSVHYLRGILPSIPNGGSNPGVNETMTTHVFDRWLSDTVYPPLYANAKKYQSTDDYTVSVSGSLFRDIANQDLSNIVAGWNGKVDFPKELEGALFVADVPATGSNSPWDINYGK